MTDVPFAIGEEFSSKWQFAPYIEQGLTNFRPGGHLQRWRSSRRP